MKTEVLSLDLSTANTGWALLDSKTLELLDYGCIKPKVEKLSKLKYPERQLKICISISEQIKDLIEKCQPLCIVVEEINAHRNRMSGKTLDILHGIMWYFISQRIKTIYYMDSDGRDGWRSKLRLIMSDADRQHNKESKSINKTLKSKDAIPIITKKTLACRYVNKLYGKTFDIDKNNEDSDICDAIGLGYAFLMYKFNK